MASLGHKGSSHEKSINGAFKQPVRATRTTKLEDPRKIYQDWSDFSVDVETLIERYDLNLRSNGNKKNVWKCNEKDCSFKLSAGRKNGKGVIVFDRKGSFYTHSHDVFEKPKSQRVTIVKKDPGLEKNRKAKKLKLEDEQTSDHEDVASLFSFLNQLAPDVFTGLERVFLSVGLTAPLLSDAHEDELGGIMEALRNGRYGQKSLDEALIKRFQRKMNEFIETEERRKGMRDVGVGGE